jgi:hypothetical protein
MNVPSELESPTVGATRIVSYGIAVISLAVYSM